MRFQVMAWKSSPLLQKLANLSILTSNIEPLKLIVHSEETVYSGYDSSYDHHIVSKIFEWYEDEDCNNVEIQCYTLKKFLWSLMLLLDEGYFEGSDGNTFD